VTWENQGAKKGPVMQHNATIIRKNATPTMSVRAVVELMEQTDAAGIRDYFGTVLSPPSFLPDMAQTYRLVLDDGRLGDIQFRRGNDFMVSGGLR
jgi:hypothetical protein